MCLIGCFCRRFGLCHQSPTWSVFSGIGFDVLGLVSCRCVLLDSVHSRVCDACFCLDVWSRWTTGTDSFWEVHAVPCYF